MSIRKEDALLYHKQGRPGKIEIVPTVPVATIRDLALAYSPGVAYPCLEIAENPDTVYDYTARGNLVAVISNGTAVLGLGNIGPLAAKPVMEGKAILFKKYADIDGVDIEISATDVDEFCRVVKALEPSFGGINLEDIKAPEAFAIEERLRAEMGIPIMHDDQHGTAIISAAGLVNALELAGKSFETAKLIVSGAGASARACIQMYLALGLRLENLWVYDSKGLLTTERDDLDQYKLEFARSGPSVPLSEAVQGADVLVGLSRAGLFTPQMVQAMAKNPVVFALANPDPEIGYPEAKAARPDVIMATGRSDYPNQVNNVLGFPYIFRGALDVRAHTINEEMKMAAALAIARLTKEPTPELVAQIYAGERLVFGPEYLIPKPMDPRLMIEVSTAVAKAACETGVARKPIDDLEAYRAQLIARQGGGPAFMRTLTTRAKGSQKTLVFPEGEDYKILKAAQILADEGVANSILLGRRSRIEKLLKEYKIDIPNLRILEPDEDRAQLERFAHAYHASHQRKGVTYQEALRMVWQRNYYGCMLVAEGLADGLITGLTRNYHRSVKPLLDIIPREPGIDTVSGLYILRSAKDTYFFADTTMVPDPTVDQLVTIARATHRSVSRLGRQPRIALLSFSNFGTSRHALPDRMAKASAILRRDHPDWIVDGDLQANLALRPDLLSEFFPFTALHEKGANTFIFPGLASANIAYKLLQEIGGLEAVGPLLQGLSKPVHVLQMGASVREIVNLSTLAVVDAGWRS
ncbi:MAG: NADP-dependent malic enzyme [Bacteroidia bacterium]|nr:NADP-dependent malic enzyme [Bacteroidia bacterium]